MSISVYDAMHLRQLKPLELVAGVSGLDKLIDRIGILDHEIVAGIVGGFMPGDFVLTTFTAARNDVTFLEQCVKDLITCNISALAIKKIFYHVLPESVIQLANDHALPIFMFEEDVYFEHIMEDLFSGIQTRSHMELLASKIELLFKNELKKPAVLELANELNPSFLREHVVYYLKEPIYINEDQSLQLAERYHRSRQRSLHHSVIKFHEGIMIILTYKKIKEMEVSLDLQFILKHLNIKKEDYYIGRSEFNCELSDLDRSIKESVYASETAEIYKKNKMNYDEIGIYKILLPYKKDPWLKHFTMCILEPIKTYDEGKLLETARVYIQEKGNIIKTAERLFTHKNTIRYRLNKIEALMNIGSEGDFYEQLSIAIKCEPLI